jgi:hypothetical protein
MTNEIAIRVTGKELAVIHRPWHVRVWDATGRKEWEVQALEALRNRNQATLAALVRQWETDDPSLLALDPRTTRPTYVFNFAPDIVADYLPLIGRRV